MDGLWDPPNYQAVEDTTCEVLPLANFWTEPVDVMEETALNEKSCIQVLRFLISKADYDIFELEEELMDLLSQLVYTDEQFSDMFTMSMRLKINILDLSIRKLRDDAVDFLSISSSPAESINDILKSLFCDHLQKKDKQNSADYTTSVSSSCPQLCADNPFKEKNQMGSSSNANQMEISEGVIVTSLKKHTTIQARVKTEEEDANYREITSDNLHNMSPASKNSALVLYWGSMEKKMNSPLNKFQIKNPTMAKDVLLTMTPRFKSICKNQLFKTQGKCKDQLKVIKSQTDALLELSHHGIDVDHDSDPKQMRRSQATIKQENNHEERASSEDLPAPHVSLSVSVSSIRTYKRRQKLDSLFQTSLSAPCCSLGIDVHDGSSLDMDDYTVDELKAIAKKREVKGYYKLRKPELAQALGIKITEGKRKQKRKETLPVSLPEDES